MTKGGFTDLYHPQLDVNVLSWFTNIEGNQIKIIIKDRKLHRVFTI